MKKYLMILVVFLYGCGVNLNVEKPEPIQPEMVLVEGGEFLKGHRTSDMEHHSQFWADTKVIPHWVTLTKDFLISKYEVTVEQFFPVYNYGLDTGELRLGGWFNILNGVKSYDINENSLQGVYPRWLIKQATNRDGFYLPQAEVREGRLVLARDDAKTKPIIGVSWYGAIWYCNLLSRIEGLDEFYEITSEGIKPSGRLGGYRLPTEAEWEWAARGGRKSKGYKYIGADDKKLTGYDYIPGKPNPGGPIPVGKYRPNELGIYDMAGNAIEWVWDWFGQEDSESRVDPWGPEAGELKILKGGGWYNGGVLLLPAARMERHPNSQWERNGIRLVRDLVE